MVVVLLRTGSKGNLQHEPEVTDMQHSVEATTLYSLIFTTTTTTTTATTTTTTTTTTAVGGR